jgi:hypothetical protein
MTTSKLLKRLLDGAFHKVFGLTEGGVTLNAGRNPGSVLGANDNNIQRAPGAPLRGPDDLAEWFARRTR